MRHVWGSLHFWGEAVRDVCHKFRIEIGPLPVDTYRRFLPGEQYVTALRDWVRQYLGIEYQWAVRSDFAQRRCRWRSAGRCRSQRPGWGAQPQPEARGDLVFSPEVTLPVFNLTYN